MACLRAVDATVLEGANSNINLAGFFGTFVLVPVVDGDFIAQPATTALRERRVNGVTFFFFANRCQGLNQDKTRCGNYVAAGKYKYCYLHCY